MHATGTTTANYAPLIVHLMYSNRILFIVQYMCTCTLFHIAMNVTQREQNTKLNINIEFFFFWLAVTKTSWLLVRIHFFFVYYIYVTVVNPSSLSYTKKKIVIKLWLFFHLSFFWLFIQILFPKGSSTFGI